MAVAGSTWSTSTVSSARHARDDRVLRILHDGDAAMLLDHAQAIDAIAERTRQDDSDHARSIDAGGTSEQRFDRGAEAVLARSVQNPQPLRRDEQVIVRPGHIDRPRLDRIVVHRELDGQRSGTLEDPRQHTVAARARVHRHQHGRRQCRRQPFDQRGQSLQSSGGCADDDDVAGHAYGLVYASQPFHLRKYRCGLSRTPAGAIS